MHQQTRILLVCTVVGTLVTKASSSAENDIVQKEEAIRLMYEKMMSGNLTYGDRDSVEDLCSYKLWGGYSAGPMRIKPPQLFLSPQFLIESFSCGMCFMIYRHGRMLIFKYPVVVTGVCKSCNHGDILVIGRTGDTIPVSYRAVPCPMKEIAVRSTYLPNDVLLFEIRNSKYPVTRLALSEPLERGRWFPFNRTEDGKFQTAWPYQSTSNPTFFKLTDIYQQYLILNSWMSSKNGTWTWTGMQFRNKVFPVLTRLPSNTIATLSTTIDTNTHDFGHENSEDQTKPRPHTIISLPTSSGSPTDMDLDQSTSFSTDYPSVVTEKSFNVNDQENGGGIVHPVNSNQTSFFAEGENEVMFSQNLNPSPITQTDFESDKTSLTSHEPTQEIQLSIEIPGNNTIDISDILDHELGINGALVGSSAFIPPGFALSSPNRIDSLLQQQESRPEPLSGGNGDNNTALSNVESVMSQSSMSSVLSNNISFSNGTTEVYSRTSLNNLANATHNNDFLTPDNENVFSTPPKMSAKKITVSSGIPIRDIGNTTIMHRFLTTHSRNESDKTNSPSIHTTSLSNTISDHEFHDNTFYLNSTVPSSSTKTIDGTPSILAYISNTAASVSTMRDTFENLTFFETSTNSNTNSAFPEVTHSNDSSTSEEKSTKSNVDPEGSKMMHSNDRMSFEETFTKPNINSEISGMINSNDSLTLDETSTKSIVDSEVSEIILSNSTLEEISTNSNSNPNVSEMTHSNDSSTLKETFTKSNATSEVFETTHSNDYWTLEEISTKSNAIIEDSIMTHSNNNSTIKETSTKSNVFPEVSDMTYSINNSTLEEASTKSNADGEDSGMTHFNDSSTLEKISTTSNTDSEVSEMTYSNTSSTLEETFTKSNADPDISNITRSNDIWTLEEISTKSSANPEVYDMTHSNTNSTLEKTSSKTNTDSEDSEMTHFNDSSILEETSTKSDTDSEVSEMTHSNYSSMLEQVLSHHNNVTLPGTNVLNFNDYKPNKVSSPHPRDETTMLETSSQSPDYNNITLPALTFPHNTQPTTTPTVNPSKNVTLWQTTSHNFTDSAMMLKMSTMNLTNDLFFTETLTESKTEPPKSTTIVSNTMLELITTNHSDITTMSETFTPITIDNTTMHESSVTNVNAATTTSPMTFLNNITTFQEASQTYFNMTHTIPQNSLTGSSTLPSDNFTWNNSSETSFNENKTILTTVRPTENTTSFEMAATTDNTSTPFAVTGFSEPSIETGVSETQITTVGYKSNSTHISFKTNETTTSTSTIHFVDQEGTKTQHPNNMATREDSVLELPSVKTTSQTDHIFDIATTKSDVVSFLPTAPITAPTTDTTKKNPFFPPTSENLQETSTWETTDETNATTHWDHLKTQHPNNMVTREDSVLELPSVKTTSQTNHIFDIATTKSDVVSFLPTAPTTDTTKKNPFFPPTSENLQETSTWEMTDETYATTHWVHLKTVSYSFTWPFSSSSSTEAGISSQDTTISPAIPQNPSNFENDFSGLDFLGSFHSNNAGDDDASEFSENNIGIFFGDGGQDDDDGNGVFLVQPDWTSTETPVSLPPNGIFIRPPDFDGEGLPLHWLKRGGERPQFFGHDTTSIPADESRPDSSVLESESEDNHQSTSGGGEVFVNWTAFGELALCTLLIRTLIYLFLGIG